MANARRAYAKLTFAPLPPEGSITFVKTPEEAVTDVDFVQESAPERVELKQELLLAPVVPRDQTRCLVLQLQVFCQRNCNAT